jgi:hypothetical protein
LPSPELAIRRGRGEADFHAPGPAYSTPGRVQERAKLAQDIDKGEGSAAQAAAGVRPRSWPPLSIDMPL